MHEEPETIGPTGLMGAAIATWDEGLARIEDPDAWVASATAQVRAAGLVLKGEPLLAVARPRLLAREVAANDQAVVDAAAAALAAAGDLALAEPALRSRYLGGWLDDSPTADLVRLPSGYPQRIVLGRFDGVRRPDGLRIMEFNGGLPGGAMPTDVTADIMRGWSPYPALAERWDVQIPTVVDGVWRGLLETWADFGGTGLPAVLFAVPDELRDYVATPLGYVVRAAERHGAEVAVADPGALAHGAGGLTLDGRRIDVVVRVFFTPMIATLGNRLDALFAAVRAGDVCLITSMRSGMYGHKGLFAMVTDPEVDIDVPPEVRRVAQAHLPWTRVVAAGRTLSPEGDHVDLLEYALTHRDSLVLKPSDGYGGMGVTLGWETSSEAWTAALDAAADGTWIVQSRMELTTDEFPALAPGLPRHTYVEDHNPIVANGRIVGYFVRLAAAGGITNLTSGAGSVVPTFLLDDPAPAQEDR